MQAEVEGLLKMAPNANARLLMLIQWRAGLRISEAPAVEPRDLQLHQDNPTLRVRRGKGNLSRLVPVHPELAATIDIAMDYRSRKDRPIVVTVWGRRASRSTASDWIAQAVDRAVEVGLLAPGRKVSSHTLRHSYARHMLAHGIPLNVLSLWLGHSSIQTTLRYLKLMPDPEGRMGGIP